MSIQDLVVIALQVALPLTLIGWLLLAPLAGRLRWLLQVLAIGLVLTALFLVASWMYLPWWVPRVYLLLWLLALLRRVPDRLREANAGRPGLGASDAALALLVILAAWASLLTVQALAGRSPPRGAQVVELGMPLGPGTYLVASGGASAAVNDHILTLDPQTERQKAYRGQSYAADLIKLGPWGFRTRGWRPADPSVYTIFGEPVFAPCSGQVIGAADGLPDMRVPETDTSQLEGNHVLINCEGTGVLLAHLRQHTVRVNTGDAVAEGQMLGEVGNSGQSTEPHLHLHVQRLAPGGAPPLSGEPLFFRLDGDFPVRNHRYRVTQSP